MYILTYLIGCSLSVPFTTSFFILLYLLTLNMTPKIMALLLCFVLPIFNFLMVSASSMVLNVTNVLRMPTYKFWPGLFHCIPDNYSTPPSGYLLDWTTEISPGAPYHLSQITTHLFQISSHHSRFFSFLHTPFPVYLYYILLALSTLIIIYVIFLNYCRRFQFALPATTHTPLKSDFDTASCGMFLKLKTDHAPHLFQSSNSFTFHSKYKTKHSVTWCLKASPTCSLQ